LPANTEWWNIGVLRIQSVILAVVVISLVLAEASMGEYLDLHVIVEYRGIRMEISCD
jgi:hypothetical protein